MQQGTNNEHDKNKTHTEHKTKGGPFQNTQTIYMPPTNTQKTAKSSPPSPPKAHQSTHRKRNTQTKKQTNKLNSTLTKEDANGHNKRT